MKFKFRFKPLMKLVIWTMAFAALFQVEAADDAENWAPDFLIIGARQSGTTDLYNFINKHPKMVNKWNETHFFDHNFQQGVAWYKSQFDPRPEPDYIVGDKSPYYFFDPKVPERVKSLYPNVKLLLILRNPIDRAYFQYWDLVRNDHEQLSFEDAIKAESQRMNEKIKKNPKGKHSNRKKTSLIRKYSYVSRGIYVEQVKRWLAHFPKEQLMVISFEEFQKSPRKIMDKVFAFLGVKEFKITDKIVESHNESCPPMDPKTRAELVAFYRPYNEQLENLLGRKFNWDQ